MKHCIFTVVNYDYVPYVPLFKYCAKKAYPECDVLVYMLSGNNIEFRNDINRIIVSSRADDGIYTACQRFLMDDLLKDYYTVLITDIDMLMYRENIPYYESRAASMEKHGLVCYDNCVIEGRMPGVHFVTQAWWSTTKDMRYRSRERIDGMELHKDDDEIMLRHIVEESGLQTTPWGGGEHGVHLGRFRIEPRPCISGPMGCALDDMFKDAEFKVKFYELQKKLAFLKKISDIYK